MLEAYDLNVDELSHMADEARARQARLQRFHFIREGRSDQLRFGR